MSHYDDEMDAIAEHHAAMTKARPEMQAQEARIAVDVEHLKALAAAHNAMIMPSAPIRAEVVPLLDRVENWAVERARERAGLGEEEPDHSDWFQHVRENMREHVPSNSWREVEDDLFPEMTSGEVHDTLYDGSCVVWLVEEDTLTLEVGSLKLISDVDNLHGYGDFADIASRLMAAALAFG